MVFINAVLTHLELLPNFHDENTATFCLIFVVEIRQHFGSGASWHTKYYSHQAFTMRIQQKDAPFSWKKSGRVSYLCIWHASICSYQGKPRLTKASNTLMRVTYTGKPMSLVDMDQGNHTVIIMHTMQHEYAFTIVTLNAYPHSKVKSTHDHEGGTFLNT